MDHTKRVIMVNQSFQALAYITWDKAASLLYQGKADAIGEPLMTVHSPSVELVIPQIVALKSAKYVHFPNVDHADSRVTKKRILMRDNYTCAYCLGKADTVDHIMPKSRGGLNTWDNLIAACFKCNNKKNDLTPIEARMEMLFTPKEINVNPHAVLQGHLEDILTVVV